MMADHGVTAFCTTCRNRTPHLRQTLSRNLADNPRSLFVLLNYNTNDDLLDFVQSKHRAELESGRLRVYSYFDWPEFRMAHAKNLSHRLAIRDGAGILVNLDADNFAGPAFESWIGGALTAAPRAFLWARMQKGQMTRGVNGRIVLTKNAFLKSGGYDEEKFVGWGSDDKDLNLRLRALGYDGVEIDPVYLNAVPHSDKMRFKDYPHLRQESDEFFAVDKSTVNGAVVNAGKIGCGIVYSEPERAAPIILEPLPTRVFGIGMHRTATSSLHQALQVLGYDSWHWRPVREAKAIWAELRANGRSPTLERYGALSDLPIPLLYRQLEEAYPGSKFILTIRGERDWLNAVQWHFSTANPWRSSWDSDPFSHKVHQLLYGRKSFDADVFLARYRRHNAEVLEYFADRPGALLVLNMSNDDGWRELCGFLNCPIPAVGYPHLHRSEEAAHIIS